jgi:DNA-binding MurR/RpiR family transcriptional regulator
LAQLASMPCTSTERRIVEYLLTLPQAQLALLRAPDVVRQTGCSRSTLDRVARKAGQPGFSQLRRALVSEQDQVFDGDALDPSIGTADTPEQVATKVLGSISSRAKAFAQVLLSDGRLARVVDLVDRAEHVVLCGAGLSAMVAVDMHHRLLRLGIDVKYSDDSHTQVAYAALMGAGDVAICVSYSGRSDTVVEAARLASKAGTAVALTADPNSPLARCCRVTITTPPGVGLFGNDAALTRILQMGFTDVLFHCLALRNPTRLQSVEQIDQALRTFKLEHLARDQGDDHERRDGPNGY